MKTAVYIIGEIGQAHDGCIHTAHAYIDALAHSGVDAVKFQMHLAEAESSPYEPFRIPPLHVTETRMEYWKRMEFTPEQWAGLKTHCAQHQLDFIVTPSSIQAVDLLEKLEICTYKVGSGDTCNLLLLDRIIRTGKSLMISTGMSTSQELDLSCHFLKKRKALFSLLQCTSSYPTQDTQWGLNQIQYLREKYNVTTGFSDHSGDIYACLAATALGAKILEFHVTFDKQSLGPDTSSSLDMHQIQTLTTGVRKIENALSHPTEKVKSPEFQDVKNIFEKSLSVNKSMRAGHVLSLGDLESKKPVGRGIPVHLFESVLGKTLQCDLEKWTFLTEKDIL